MGQPIGHPDFYGTALVHGIQTRIPGTTYTIAPLGTQASGQLLISKPGYIIQLAATCPGTSTVPFIQVQLHWYDPTGSFHTGYDEWVIPATAAGDYFIVGKGPAKGGQFQLIFANPDPAQTISVQAWLLETTHHITRDDWRARTIDTVPGVTSPPFSNPGANLLFNTGGGAVSVPATTTLTYLLPLYSGQVWYEFLASPTNIQVQIETTPAVPHSMGGDAYLYENLTITDVTVTITQPRVPLIMKLINTGGAATNVIATATILEYAS